MMPGRRSKHLGHAEITQKRVPFCVEQNIARLDIAVDVALRVNIVECLGNGLEPGRDRFGVARIWLPVAATWPAILERSTREKLHDSERYPVPGPDVADLDDVGMRQLYERADLRVKRSINSGSSIIA